VPAAELAVWLVPGYLALLLYTHVNPIKSKQSYEWFFQAAAFGILAFIVASIVSFTWTQTFGRIPSPARFLDEQVLSRWWASHYPFSHSSLWAIAVVASPLVALVASWGRLLWNAFKWVLDHLTPPSRPADIFLDACRKLENELVIVSVDGGRIYVGFLTDFTTDPDESEKYIRLLPLMSGRRDAAQGLVNFTTPYFTDLPAEPRERELEELAARRAILIPANKIITFAPFDRKLHEWFKAHDLVKLSFDLEPAEGSAS
jgi:hypothetical protein